MFAAPPGTAIFHALEKGWATTEYLLAQVIDALLVANWQRTEDATKRPPRNVPKQFPRPGDEPAPGEGSVVSVAGVPAKVTTVGKFLEQRALREQRWRRRNRRR